MGLHMSGWRTLHSNMFLLIPVTSGSGVVASSSNLQSNMFLLIHGSPASLVLAGAFTFQYVSINTRTAVRV